MKRYKIIEIKENCKNKEYHMIEYHDGYVDCKELCKINNEACDEEYCNHKQFPLEGFSKEEMIDKMAKAFCELGAPNTWYEVEDDYRSYCLAAAEAALNALLGDKK